MSPLQSGALGHPGHAAVFAGQVEFEVGLFEGVTRLAQENGSMTRVAEKTGLERTHLYRKLKQLGVDLSRNKRGAG